MTFCSLVCVARNKVIMLSGYLHMQFLICLIDRSQVEAQLHQDLLADHQRHSTDRKQSQDYHGRQRLSEVNWKMKWA